MSAIVDVPVDSLLANACLPMKSPCEASVEATREVSPRSVIVWFEIEGTWKSFIFLYASPAISAR